MAQQGDEFLTLSKLKENDFAQFEVIKTEHEFVKSIDKLNSNESSTNLEIPTTKCIKYFDNL